MTELIARMAVMLEALRVQGDQRQFFHATYLRTTIAVAGDIERGSFIDAAWVEKWDIAFAELYLDALGTSLAGRRPARPGPGTSRSAPPLIYPRSGTCCWA